MRHLCILKSNLQFIYMYWNNSLGLLNMEWPEAFSLFWRLGRGAVEMSRVKMSCGRDDLYRLNVEEIKESYNIKETYKLLEIFCIWLLSQKAAMDNIVINVGHLYFLPLHLIYFGCTQFVCFTWFSSLLRHTWSSPKKKKPKKNQIRPSILQCPAILYGDNKVLIGRHVCICTE